MNGKSPTSFSNFMITLVRLYVWILRDPLRAFLFNFIYSMAIVVGLLLLDEDSMLRKGQPYAWPLVALGGVLIALMLTSYRHTQLSKLNLDHSQNQPEDRQP